MQLFLQLSKLQGTTSYFDENVGRVGVKSDTVNMHIWAKHRVVISENLMFMKQNYLSFLSFKLNYKKFMKCRLPKWQKLKFSFIKVKKI